MILIIGLGNPGKKYENTRHNIGSMAIDKTACSFQFSDFDFQPIFNAKIAKGEINGKKIILAKPGTFMNESGKTAKKLISKLRLQISSLWVVHDDIDLPLGKIRIVKNRGSAGHKGIESVIKELKTKDFTRFRIGIKTGTNPDNQRIKNQEKFVLQKFPKNEEKIAEQAVKKTVEAIETALKESPEKAMNKYNR